MAEYKYRALGWKDDDIASLNVVDGTAADNQVELQITKQGTGGTIDGPAIIGKDGITINKAADSEKIEISGSGLVQHNTNMMRDFAVYATIFDSSIQGMRDYIITIGSYPAICTNGQIAMYYGANRDVSTPPGMLITGTPTQEAHATNKKYVDDNFVAKVTNTNTKLRIYGIDSNSTNNYIFEVGAEDIWCKPGVIPRYNQISYTGKAEPTGALITATPVNNYQCATKKYVDEAVAGSSTTVDGTSIVKDTDGKIQLNQEYIKYLDNQLYQPPAISVFTMLDAAGAAIPTSNELGTTLSAAAFNHQETNIKNIQGDNVELHINNAAAATTSTAKKDIATKVTLTTAQSITSSTKFTLKSTNTKGAAFSRDYQVNFYRYAYTATTDATTAPTSGATQQAAVSTFASNGSTFNYTKGAYIYFYTDNTGKKVQTNVLGQWADVDTTDMGKVTLTQNNGATHEYTCYRIGPFIETGSAKYRV